MAQAQHIKADGTVTDVNPEKGKKFTLQEAQGYVNGYVQIITDLGGGQIMIINSDAGPLRLPYNQKATDLLRVFNPRVIDIHGDVLLCDKKAF